MKDIIRIFKALSNPTRLRILRLLRERDLCVCEIMAVLNMKQSRISHQMRILREAGLAEDFRQGRWIIYRIPESSRKLVEGLFSGSLLERLEDDQEVSKDRRKFKSCLKEDLCSKICPRRKT